MSIGQTIINRRKEMGITQEELAEKSGISLRTIQRIEKDETEARSFTLKTLAESLEIEFSDLSIESGDLDEVIFHELKVINLASLFGLFIPFCNMVFPYILRNRFRSHQLIYKHSAIILSFQVIWWFMMALFMLLSIPLQKSFNEFIGMNISLIFFILIVFYVFNFVVILINQYRLVKNDLNIYPKTPSLL